MCPPVKKKKTKLRVSMCRQGTYTRAASGGSLACLLSLLRNKSKRTNRYTHAHAETLLNNVDADSHSKLLFQLLSSELAPTAILIILFFFPNLCYARRVFSDYIASRL